ncbi:uncharacterized protein Fs isoform X2 [Drosophila pseudoobscura]|uniref:Uncharacterized protein Fs isoform X2 n=1 Tax=Drosophila pseudoobscura pseudoobscura TaxID=46245 RepID=A0A6I8VDL7_DROPS|nr:uncharacterized protein LOC6898052 isoform X2 [Drosophila pseudoobscura]
MPHHHQTNSHNHLTFLKSNYKFKRREMPTIRALPVASAEARTPPNQLAATMSKTSAASESAATAVASTSTTTTSHKSRSILSLFIVIAWNSLQELASDGKDDGCVRAAGDHGRDVNADRVRHRRTPGTRDPSDEVSMAREHHKQQGKQKPLSGSSPHRRRSRLRATSQAVSMALFALGLLLLNMRPAEAGTCWQTHLGSGKCSQIFSTNITKSECCGASQTFSYTDRELSSVEYFFATAIGGGVECAPCIENCKGFKCGPNKKCVKRKGRPKCVCAPECGAALRRRQHQKLWKMSPTVAVTVPPPRGSRSLSGEIFNNNPIADNQRKHQQRQRQHEHEQEQTQEMQQMLRRQSHKKAQGETKYRRLLIIDSSSSSNSNSNSNSQELPTARRSGGRVEMTGYERRRHRNNQGKHFTRSMTTGANDSSKADKTPAQAALSVSVSVSTPAPAPASASAQSRHKFANANEPANDSNRQYQKLDNAPFRHQKATTRTRRIEHAPNHDNGQREPRRHRRPKHSPGKDHEQHEQRFGTAVNPAEVAETEAEADTSTAAASTLAANTTMSGAHAQRRLYLDEHGSEMTASSAAAAAATAVADGHSISISHGHLANAGDLAFLGGIYEPVLMQHQQQHKNPVCGTDGRTYNTECQLRKRACRTSNAQLEVAYRGHCKSSCRGVQCLNGLTCVEDQYLTPHCIPCKIECPREEEEEQQQAVCGVDGKTYRSLCDINRMICKTGRSIAVAYSGPCRADRVSCADIICGPKDTCLVDLETRLPRCVSCRYNCPKQRLVHKICGFNNHTYSSWCEVYQHSCSTGFFIGVKAAGSC